ncbi:TetR family transcriptional regulator [Cycloclasticus sp. 46_120_T64]|nr:TetR family transcriptional regulator [Cycloclasticus sp. 46_120_T64]
MRVLFISRAYPPTIGGIENQNEALARHLAKVSNCQVIANKYGKKALPFFIPLTLIKAIMLLKKIDIILLGDGVAAIIGWLIKLVTNKPVVCVLHGLDVTWQNKVYQKLWVSFFFNRIDHFIAVSQSTKEITIKAGIPEQKISVIPNGVEESPITPLSKEELSQKLNISLDDKFILLSLGRLIKRKGVLWFIENVVTTLPKDILYLVAGNGPDKRHLESAIKHHKLTGQVFLLGSVNNLIKESLFTHSNLFIQPNIPVKNDVEGFGITQLEAGIRGLPSLSSNLEGISDAIQEGKNGWLVEPLNKQEFSRVINERKILLGNSTPFKLSVIQHCKNNFEWPSIAHRYSNTLLQILDTPN